MTKKKLPIECGEGWHDIVWACHRELFRIDPDYQPLQIKEKFGGLRYYFKPSNPSFRDEMDAVVAKYEELAAKTCEVTGNPGVLMKSPGNWYKTLSPEYAESKLYYAKYRPVEKK